MSGLLVEVEHDFSGGFRIEAAFKAAAGVTCLFGRSGSGKSSLVNVIAGLLRPRRGRVVLDGVALLDTERGVSLPRHRRRIGYVFQDGRLFPHLSVRRNLAFGRWFAPRERGGPSETEVVELLGIGHLLDRPPGNLSGGEKQRVAIGRALLARPRLLLMDEPLASLDESRRAEILPYLERLRDETRIPIVYVSHAMGEVARLATTLVLVENGRVTASGEAGSVLARLDLGAIARAREGGAVLEARIVSHDPAFGLTRVTTPAGEIDLPRLDRPVGTALRVQVQARDVVLSLRAPEGLSALNVLTGTVAEISADTGRDRAGLDIRLDCGGAAVLARITRKSAQGLGLAVGVPVHAIVKAVAFDEP